MHLVHARLKLDPTRSDDFTRYINELIPIFRREPGNHSYDYYQDPLDPSRGVVIEVWGSKQDHLAHAASETHAELVERSPSLGVIEAQVTIYDDDHVEQRTGSPDSFPH